MTAVQGSLPNTALYEGERLYDKGRFETLYAEDVRLQHDSFLSEAESTFRGISHDRVAVSLNFFAATPVAPQLIMIARHSLNPVQVLRLTNRNHVPCL